MTIADPDKLLNDVNAALQADTRIDIDDLMLELGVDDGVLVLRGNVDSIREKRIAANVAGRAVNGQCPVRDELFVRGAATGDLELRDDVAKTLAAEGAFLDYSLSVVSGSHRDSLRHGQPGAGHIEAIVDNGCVALEGEVGSLSHRRLAEVLVWWRSGCRRVDNRLAVTPPEEDHDNEITDAVRIALEKDPLVHATQLRVGTAAGVVEIRGLVTSEQERKLAINDGWYVPGVWDVVDHIAVFH